MSEQQKPEQQEQRHQERQSAPAGSPSQPAGIAADASEAGLKLIALLERRLGLPRTLLHRWIRTGQVRLNGSRPQPFTRVAAGDQIRVPPFAQAMSEQARAAARSAAARSAARGPLQASPAREPGPAPSLRTAASAPGVDIVGRHGDLLCVLKPAGLPTHPGSGHADSLSSRLVQAFPGAVFPPTPVHRLDRDTSGLLLVATTFESLRKAQELFRARSGIVKEYLAWAEGDWPWQEAATLRHWLAVRRTGGIEKMAASSVPGDGREACLAARPLARRAGATLLQIRLLTGRKHQIRVQLAAAGHPVVGDPKYGSGRARGGQGLLLHAFRIVLPDGAAFASLPSWGAPYGVSRMPDPMEAAGADA